MPAICARHDVLGLKFCSTEFLNMLRLNPRTKQSSFSWSSQELKNPKTMYHGLLKNGAPEIAPQVEEWEFTSEVASWI